MILVCATGLDGSTAGDVAKEVAIYRAHKAAPIVIASAGTSFPAALHTIEVPVVHPVPARVWAVQRRLHVHQPVIGYGRLLEELP